MRISMLAAFVATMFVVGGCSGGSVTGGESGETVSPDQSDTAETSAAAISPDARSSTFRFFYAGALTDLEPGTLASVWLPIAVTGVDQTVEIVSIELPGEYRETVEPRYRNSLIYFEAEANQQGEIPFEIAYQIERKELPGQDCDCVGAAEKGLFLTGSSKVPVDGSLTSQLFGSELPQGEALDVARQVYDTIDLHMRYDKPLGEPWGQGDAVWACDSRFGNCTDFHSLFLAVCRDLGIPGKFEIGFSIPPGGGDVGGYHCWAKFAAEGCWVPVDISEADKHPELREYYFGALTSNRVAFSVGRDLTLSPPQQSGPVNFLVYPYAEVDGEPHPHFRGAFRSEAID